MKIYVPIAPVSKFSYEMILLTCSAVLETKCSKIASCLITEIRGGWAMKDKIGESSPGSKYKATRIGQIIAFIAQRRAVLRMLLNPSLNTCISS